MGDKRRVMGTAGGAVGLGGFAAALGLCCGVPGVVALFGVGGAILFARLAFLVPYALVASAILLGVGFWLAYRPLPRCDDGSCAPESRHPLRVIVWIATAAVAALAVIALSPTALAASADTRVYTHLDEVGSPLRDDFNRARGSVRLLFVVDPTCPFCLRGLDDLNRSLLAKTDDERLQTFVVHVPVFGGKAKDIASAAKLLENDHVRNYWNPSATFGRMLAEALNFTRGDELIYAWDVWLIYGPDAVWQGALPPRPQRVMHQLRALGDSEEWPRLDSEVFAREARALIAGLPAPAATP